MLELYHWEPNGASARVLISLTEKGIDFSSRYLDVLAFEQHAAAFLGLNASGEVPVLVHDGVVYTEAAFIGEYLDELFAGLSLRPANPRGRWQVRAWQKYVDDSIAASVSDLAWHAYGAASLKGRDGTRLAAAVARIPATERRDAWARALAGLSEQQLTRCRERLAEVLRKLEADLGHSGWLAASNYSLADIAAFAFMNFLPRLMPEAVNDAATPRTMAWLRKLAARPGVRAALAMARTPDPFAIAAPGPEQVRWG